MHIKTDFVPFDIKAMPDETGVFEGYGSVFGNVDAGRDMVMRGAFAESIAKALNTKRMPKLLWQHDMREPIGVWLEMREDDHGLYVKGKFTKGVKRADEAYALMKDGAIDGLSIGYRTLDDDIDRDLGVRKLKKLDLMEVSVVTLPMNEAATVTGVKALLSGLSAQEWRDLEAALRDEDLSRADSVKAVSGLKKYLQRDAGGPIQAPRDEAAAAELRSYAERFRAMRPSL